MGPKSTKEGKKEAASKGLQKHVQTTEYVEVTGGLLTVAIFLGGVFGLLTSIFYYSQVSVFLLPFSFSENMTVYTFLLIVVFAPFGEELMKVMPGVFLETEEELTFSPFGWMILGIGSGLGFTLLENMLYGVRFVSQFNWYGGGLLLLARFLLPVHMLTTSIASYGIGAWKETVDRKYLVFLLVAMLIHAFHNLFALFLRV